MRLIQFITFLSYNLMSLAILFHFLCAQHVSDINISIVRSLRLFCWITTLVVLFLVRCVLEFRCGWVGVVSVLQAEAQLLLFYFTSYVLNMFRTLIYLASGDCDYYVELPHWSYCSCFDVFWSFGLVGLEWYLCGRLKPVYSGLRFVCKVLMLWSDYYLYSGFYTLQHTFQKHKYNNNNNKSCKTQLYLRYFANWNTYLWYYTYALKVLWIYFYLWTALTWIRPLFAAHPHPPSQE